MQNSCKGFGDPSGDFFITKYLPSVSFNKVQQAIGMEGLRQKKTVYLEALENLFQELTSARSMSSGGRKFLLLGLLYDVHRVHQFFLQIESNLSESIAVHNLLQYDADVDYGQWSVRLDIKFDVNPFYLPEEEEEDANADSVKDTLWHVFDTFSRDELKGISCDRTGNVQALMNLLTNDLSADQLALVLNESVAALRESLIKIHTCIGRHRMTLDQGEELYRYERELFAKECGSSVIEEFEDWKVNSCDENEEVIRRNLKGKYCTEMLAFFMSGFLAPRISSQAETDTTEFDDEYEGLRFYNPPQGMDVKAHYSALREIFDYKDGIVVPKAGHIGKYFFKHRKEVTLEHRAALFRFVRMIWLIEEERKPKPQMAIKEKEEKKIVATTSINLFHTIIQHEEPEKLIKRLHQLIDGRKGADVGCVLLKCFQDGHLTRKPKQKEFESEFTLIGGWKAIHNYMNENDENALDRANKIIVF
ncbi:MAG: hypothetical protein IKK87_08130 [Bacteroidaceae bacterium]|nr:hypothetical protein [Bacteroidaceae bacterium]